MGRPLISVRPHRLCRRPFCRSAFTFVHEFSSRDYDEDMLEFRCSFAFLLMIGDGACSQPAPGQAGWTYGSIIIGSGRIGPGLILFNGPNLRLAPWPDTILNVFFFELIQMKLNVFGFEQNQRKLKPKRATLERSSDSIQKNRLNLDACGPSSNTSLPQAVDS